MLPTSATLDNGTEESRDAMLKKFYDFFQDEDDRHPANLSRMSHGPEMDSIERVIQPYKFKSK